MQCKHVQVAPQGSLTITNITKEDEGVYACTATNPLGNLSAISEIRVASEYKRTNLIFSLHEKLCWERKENHISLIFSLFHSHTEMAVYSTRANCKLWR